MGVGIGLMTVVGQCIGAKRKDEAIYYIKRLSWLSEIGILISCAVVYLRAKPVTILGGREAESARLCLQMVAFITITKPISWVLSFIPAYGMRAAGDVKFSMITSCASMWLCRVSLCIFYAASVTSVPSRFGSACSQTGACVRSFSCSASTPASGCSTM